MRLKIVTGGKRPFKYDIIVRPTSWMPWGQSDDGGNDGGGGDDPGGGSCECEGDNVLVVGCSSDGPPSGCSGDQSYDAGCSDVLDPGCDDVFGGGGNGECGVDSSLMTDPCDNDLGPCPHDNVSLTASGTASQGEEALLILALAQRIALALTKVNGGS